MSTAAPNRVFNQPDGCEVLKREVRQVHKHGPGGDDTRHSSGPLDVTGKGRASKSAGVCAESHTVGGTLGPLVRNLT